MKDQGSALMGIGAAIGENRTAGSYEESYFFTIIRSIYRWSRTNPIKLITGGSDLTLFEAQDATDIVAAASTSEVTLSLVTFNQ